MRLVRVLLEKFRDQISVENFRRLKNNPYLFWSFLRSLKAAVEAEKIDREYEKNNIPEILSNIFDVDSKEIYKYEKEFKNLDNFHEEFEQKWNKLERNDLLGGTAGRVDAKTMYIICRIVNPEYVIETGARYGSFDAHILAAMDKNEKGKLYSIDLPDAINRYSYGHLIPQDLRDRWELRKGDSKEVLPEILKEIDSVDVFLHDSLHKPEHMKAEYNTVYPSLNKDGVMASHDILMTNSFQSFSEKRNLNWKRINGLGISIKRE